MSLVVQNTELNGGIEGNKFLIFVRKNLDTVDKHKIDAWFNKDKIKRNISGFLLETT